MVKDFEFLIKMRALTEVRRIQKIEEFKRAVATQLARNGISIGEMVIKGLKTGFTLRTGNEKHLVVIIPTAKLHKLTLVPRSPDAVEYVKRVRAAVVTPKATAASPSSWPMPTQAWTRYPKR